MIFSMLWRKLRQAIGSRDQNQERNLAIAQTESKPINFCQILRITGSSAEMKAPGKTTQRRILVVDDEPMVCDSIRIALAFDQHQVETAASAQEALAAFHVGKFDLIIVDYNMPAM